MEAAAATTKSHNLLQPPPGLPSSKIKDEASDNSDDESAYAEFLAGLKASSSPPAAIQGTRILPELPPLSSSPVPGAPVPCLSQGLVVRCPARLCPELVLRLWVPHQQSPLVGWA